MTYKLRALYGETVVSIIEMEPRELFVIQSNLISISTPELAKRQLNISVLDGILHIHNNDHGTLSLEVVNVLGAVILRKTISSGVDLVKLNVPRGLYFVRVLQGEEMHLVKFIR